MGQGDYGRGGSSYTYGLLRFCKPETLDLTNTQSACCVLLKLWRVIMPSVEPALSSPATIAGSATAADSDQQVGTAINEAWRRYDRIREAMWLVFSDQL